MIFNFEEEMQIYDCLFEIKIGDNIQQERMKAPLIMLEQNFKQIASQAAQDNRPIKVKISRMQRIYNNFDKEWIEREFSVAFANNKYIEVYGDIDS